MKFTDLKIGSRLFICFGIIFLLLTTLGLSGLWGVSSLNSKITVKLETDGKVAEMAGLLAVQTLTLRRYEKDIFLNIDNAEKRAGYLKKWHKTVDDFHTLLKELSQASSLPEEKKLLESIGVSVLAYKKGFTGIYNDIEAGTIVTPQDGNKAMKAFKTPIREIGDLSLKIKNSSEERFHRLTGFSQSTKNKISSLIWTLFPISILLLAILGYAISRSITQPTRRVKEILQNMENGDLTERLEMARKDEIGEMADTLDRFADSMQQEIIQPLEQLSEGNISFSVAPRNDKDSLRRAIQKVSEDMNRIIGDIRSSGNQIDSASQQIADTGQTLSDGATQTAAALQQISSSISEMAAQTTQTAENASQANTLTNEASRSAQNGREQMSAMIDSMTDINEASQNINKIIKVIDEIAFQTNLLALNAAVEAARAGQHGKGFAVVAEEVRNLAARSAKAASETSELIQGSVEKTGNGSKIAARTSTALEEIVASISKVTDLVSEITIAANEQAQGISQINQGLNQVDQSVQQNTASAEESAASAEQLAGQAGQMQKLLNRFKLKDRTAPLTLVN